MEDIERILSLANSGFPAIVANFGVLFILAWSVSFVDKAVLGLDKLNDRSQPMLAGLLFGLSAILSMKIPLVFEPGIIADMRGVPLFFAGYIAGPMAAFICFSFATVTRLGIGGEGLLPGLGLILIMSLTGLFTGLVRDKLSAQKAWSAWLPVSAITLTTLACAPLMLLLPAQKQFEAFWTMEPNLLLANAVGAFLLVKLFSSERSIEILKTREEIAKRVADARIGRMIQNSPGMVYQYILKTNGDSYVKFMSDQGFRIYEIDKVDFDTSPDLPTRLVHPDDQSLLFEKILRSAQTLEWFEWQGRIVTPKGNLKWVKARSVPEKLSNGDILWDGLLIDVTKEVRLQEDLEQQRTLSAHKDKLASIGELAAGVGHEINNPLAVVLGNLSLLLEDHSKLSDLELGRLEVAEHAAMKIRDIVNGLRSFSRTDDQNEHFDCCKILDELSLLFSEIYRHQGIELEFTSLIPEASFVEGSSGQLQQSIVNLIANARDATDQQAIRKISVRSELTPDMRVRFAVGDNGPGIDQAIQDKIFNTFYTTKETGKGTGLGLSLSQRFIHNLNGTLELVSSSDKGSVFQIEVPLADIKTLAEPTSKTLTMQTLPKPLNVLIAEDAEEMAVLMKELVLEKGCKATVVNDGLEALNELTDSGQSFDLLISDIKMPKLSGIELLEKLRLNQRLHQPKVLLVTGGTNDERFTSKCLGRNTKLLYKPFGLEKLKEALIWASEDSSKALHRSTKSQRPVDTQAPRLH
ncbi:MAG: response regulator [Bdellovibrionales bacterium]|nr:response regulator [Bdellovibrionales bacterium]